VFGGMEVDPTTAIQVYEEVSRFDMSAGWNLFLSSSGITFADWIPNEGVEDFFRDDPDNIVAGALIPPGKAIPVNGGYRISGRWPFASGCQHASWLMGTAFIVDGDEPRRAEDGNPMQLIFAFPANQGEILDTWYTMGMCGTGSHDIAIDQLFVPSKHAGVLAPLERLPKCLEGPLYRMTVWFPTAALASPALGNARAAIDALLDLGAKKTPGYGSAILAARSAAQMQLGEAEALLGAARAYLYESVENAWSTALQGQFLSQREKISIQLAATHAVQSSAKVVELVHQAAGTTAIRKEFPFERYFRDAHVITQHAFVSLNRFESVGKLLFGQSTDWRLFSL
jgi:alkylation response protein AidB-like acyl-CoA dehydrogenase